MLDYTTELYNLEKTCTAIFEAEKGNNLKIMLKYFDFFKYIFVLYLLNGEKRCLPYLSEQESTINAWEFLFLICFTQHILL